MAISFASEWHFVIPTKLYNIGFNKSRMMRCEGHTGRKGETRNKSRIPLEKPDGKGPHVK
jgi:hypothetical protein